MESYYARHKVSQFQSSLTRLSISKVSFLTDAIMRTIGVSTVRISITNMTAIVAFINICEHNRFAKGNWIEEKTVLTRFSDHEAIICHEQLFCNSHLHHNHGFHYCIRRYLEA